MYGVVDVVAKSRLHIEPYHLDLALFGNLPSLTLQEIIRLPILDYMGAAFYSGHFFAPTIFAFILWKASPRNYWKYTVAFGVCTYAALITFLLYPVAPPWYQLNALYTPSYTGPTVIRILTDSVDPSLGFPVYHTIFDFLSRTCLLRSQHALRVAVAYFLVCFQNLAQKSLTRTHLASGYLV